jgi:hypothetical protein
MTGMSLVNSLRWRLRRLAERLGLRKRPGVRTIDHVEIHSFTLVPGPNPWGYSIELRERR